MIRRSKAKPRRVTVVFSRYSISRIDMVEVMAEVREVPTQTAEGPLFAYRVDKTAAEADARLRLSARGQDHEDYGLVGILIVDRAMPDRILWAEEVEPVEAVAV